MESDRQIKKFNDETIVLHSISINYIYYRCPFKGCTGKYREDIQTGEIISQRCHSSLCYNNKKKKVSECDTQNQVKKILDKLECENKRKNNDFIKSLIKKNNMTLIPTLSQNKTYLISNKYVAKVLNMLEIENLLKECDIHLSIDHPRIVNCLNYFVKGANFYLITEYCDKKSLVEINENDINEEQKIRYLNQIIEAIDFIHKNKIAHRDIKLDNIMVDKNDNIKLGDFGCASYGNIFSDVQGTYSYMCPQMKEKKNYSQKCDVWSLGITSYCLLSGHSSDRSLNLLNFTKQMEVTKTLKVHNFKKMLVDYIKELDFTGISDNNKEIIIKMLEYEEENRPNICEIKFLN